MPKYAVTLETIANVTIEVDAEDESDAFEKAFEEVPSEVCAQCSGWGNGYSLDLGEWDIPKADDGKGEAEWACEEVEA